MTTIPMSSSDVHIEVARLQNEISRKLNLSLDQLIFNHQEIDGQHSLELITINPKHNQSFLFHTITADSKVNALSLMADYVTKKSQVKQSYTVQWSQKGEGDLHTSYFRAMDMHEVLEKFYHGRTKDDYTIFSVTLNPIA
ncbi:hypothetical protein [Pontibacter sp. G13]|uniref:hypothetical protein n=1 Tax=Pontibacter sp. G13 TaxID=3074898 RepID=UPI00288C1804|nr:hypothetical protein [Pontibacter sp. G13]WNJ19405.1 hypothetical protein RJD25_02840 [Pontibacter sp. G13]